MLFMTFYPPLCLSLSLSPFGVGQIKESDVRVENILGRKVF